MESDRILELGRLTIVGKDADGDVCVEVEHKDTAEINRVWLDAEDVNEIIKFLQKQVCE